jgi:hypothetical protein
VLEPAPTVAGWRQRLASEGAFDLSSFADAELAAVGADSPVLDLVVSGAVLAADNGDPRRADLLVDGLVARGLVARIPDDPDLTLELGGDLAGIVAVRRRPALVASVMASQADVGRPWVDPVKDALLAILHGVAADGVGLFALLEETLLADRAGTHNFALATPGAAAVRIRDAYHDLRATERLSISVHVYVPDPNGPHHFQLVLTDGDARLSSDGRSWQQHVPVDEFAALFETATTL